MEKDIWTPRRPAFDAGRAERAEEVELGPITYSTHATEWKYYVEIREGTSFSCTCPDFLIRHRERKPCKHVIALVKQVGEKLVRWNEVLEFIGGRVEE